MLKSHKMVSLGKSGSGGILLQEAHEQKWQCMLYGWEVHEDCST